MVVADVRHLGVDRHVLDAAQALAQARRQGLRGRGRRGGGDLPGEGGGVRLLGGGRLPGPGQGVRPAPLLRPVPGEVQLAPPHLLRGHLGDGDQVRLQRHVPAAGAALPVQSSALPLQTHRLEIEITGIISETK